jgi:hypothetical protein
VGALPREDQLEQASERDRKNRRIAVLPVRYRRGSGGRTEALVAQFDLSELRRTPLGRSSGRRERSHRPAPIGPGTPARV